MRAVLCCSVWATLIAHSNIRSLANQRSRLLTHFVWCCCWYCRRRRCGSWCCCYCTHNEKKRFIRKRNRKIQCQITHIFVWFCWCKILNMSITFVYTQIHLCVVTNARISNRQSTIKHFTLNTFGETERDEKARAHSLNIRNWYTVARGKINKNEGKYLLKCFAKPTHFFTRASSHCVCLVYCCGLRLTNIGLFNRH